MWEGEPPEEPDQVRPRAKVTVVLVVFALGLLTLVLCCMVVGQLGAAIQLRLPRP